MMRKTAKTRSTESSAAAERLADYKGDEDCISVNDGVVGVLGGSE